MKNNRKDSESSKDVNNATCVDKSSKTGNKSVLESISMFEHTIQRRNEPVVELCKPSNIGLFQKEKLEFICQNKIDDQKKHKEDGTVPEVIYKKHEKTGEYQVAAPVSTQTKNYTKPSKIAELINKFEANVEKS
ncbi:hypothetical protein GINT2_000224 [Glugoides intestinalis]